MCRRSFVVSTSSPLAFRPLIRHITETIADRKISGTLIFASWQFLAGFNADLVPFRNDIAGRREFLGRRRTSSTQRRGRVIRVLATTREIGDGIRGHGAPPLRATVRSFELPCLTWIARPSAER